MKFSSLTAILSAAAIAFSPGFSQNAIAKDADYACFMITQSGKVIDLSKSVCGLKEPTTSTTDVPNNQASTISASSDQAFIENYQRSVANYPDVSVKLLANIQESPEATISQAKKVCEQLKSGLSLDEITAEQAQDNFDKAGVFNASLISSLAPRYYCPEVPQ